MAPDSSDHDPLPQRSAAPGPWPMASVIMPVRNEGPFIARSVGAVLGQDYPPERLEVLVVDGMSTDGTRAVLETLRAQHANLQLIDNPAKIVPTGMNLAMARARGDIVVRIDGHCEVARDYVRRCVEHLTRDSVDGVGGPLETVGETRTARVIAAAMSSRFGVGGSAFRTTRETVRDVDTIAFPAYTRAAMERAGPYDEELVRNQDDEYNYRLRKLGAKLLLSADVRARYYSRGSLRSLARQYFQYGYWKVRVLQKHPRQMCLRQFLPPLLVASLLVSAAAAPLIPAGRWLLGLIAAAYIAASVAASVLTARSTAWWMAPVLPAVYGTLHLAYGLGFLCGLVQFRSRWRRAGPTVRSPNSSRLPSPESPRADLHQV